MTTVREILVGSKRVDRSHLLARAALVGVALAVVLVALSQALGVDSYALPLVLGAAFTAKVHLSSTYAGVRGMAWVIAWMFGAALLGGPTGNITSPNITALSDVRLKKNIKLFFFKILFLENKNGK